MEHEELPIERVAFGVQRLSLRTPTLPPATHTNTYLVGETDFLVVEPASPYAPEQAALFAAIDGRIAKGHRLLGAMVTHHHVDHVSAAWALRARYGVPLMAHAETARRLAARGPTDHLLREGEDLDPALAALEIQVLHTPGHAPGHVCLLSDRHRWLIAGDMVASVGTILVDVDDGGDMDAYIDQLSRLADLAPRRILPAHGDPIEDAVGRLRFYVHHRGQREARILDAVRQGSADLGAIVARAYDDIPVSAWPLAARAARAHLQRLVKHGHVEIREGRYLPAA